MSEPLQLPLDHSDLALAFFWGFALLVSGGELHLFAGESCELGS